MADRTYQRSVRNLLIDKRFQLKYTLFVVVVSLAIFAVLGTLYYREQQASLEIMDEIRPAAQSLAAGPGGMAADDDYFKAYDASAKAEIKARDNTAVYGMLAGVGVLVLVLALFGIYVTHKIAGPVYALRQFIHAARSGQWERVRSFRKGDEFTYLAEEFKELAIQIRAGHARDVEELRDVMRLLQAGDVEAARSKVAEISRLHESHLKG